MRVLAGVLGALGALVALIGAGAGYATLRAKPPRVLFEAAPGWNANSGYLPVVMWHGMGDECCSKHGMGSIRAAVSRALNGTYTLSISTGGSPEGGIWDVLSGFWGSIDEDMRVVCEHLRTDPALKRGYVALGFSQGGQMLRGAIQRCGGVVGVEGWVGEGGVEAGRGPRSPLAAAPLLRPVHPPAHTLVTMGAQHQGVMALPGCWEPGENRTLTGWCAVSQAAVGLFVYRSLAQRLSIQAQYVKDPYRLPAYYCQSAYLRDVNNERAGCAEPWAAEKTVPLGGAGEDAGGKSEARKLRLFDGPVSGGVERSRAGFAASDAANGEGAAGAASSGTVAATLAAASSGTVAATLAAASSGTVAATLAAASSVYGNASSAADALRPFSAATDAASAAPRPATASAPYPLLPPTAEYAANLASLRRLVLYQFDSDVTVVPRQSAHFGWFDGAQLRTMEETPLYIRDKIGVRTLHRLGRLERVSVPGFHLQFTVAWFVECVLFPHLAVKVDEAWKDLGAAEGGGRGAGLASRKEAGWPTLNATLEEAKTAYPPNEVPWWVLELEQRKRDTPTWEATGRKADRGAGRDGLGTAMVLDLLQEA